MKKALLLFVSLVLAVSLFASNLQMGQSELNQSFPAATRIYFPFIGTHVGSTTATGSTLGYSTTVTGLIVTSVPTSSTQLGVMLLNLTTLQNNGIDPGSDQTTWPSGSYILCNVETGVDGCSISQNFVVTSTDQLVIRITANTGSVTIFNHITWYIPQ